MQSVLTESLTSGVWEKSVRTHLSNDRVWRKITEVLYCCIVASPEQSFCSQNPSHSRTFPHRATLTPPIRLQGKSKLLMAEFFVNLGFSLSKNKFQTCSARFQTLEKWLFPRRVSHEFGI